MPTPLQLALKKKFGTPEAALAALGLPPALLAADKATDRRTPTMTKLSKIALAARTALSAHFLPLLAADAALDLTAAVEGVTRKNFEASKAQIWARAKAIAKPLLAKDEAGPDDVAMRILDLVEKQVGAEAGPAPDPAAPGETKDIDVPVTEPNSAVPLAAKKPEEDEEEPDPEILKMLAEKLGGDENLARTRYDIMHRAKDEGPPASVETPEHQPEEPVGKDKKTKDEAPELQPVTERAMDAAITAAVAKAKQDARAAQDARAFVRPWVGEVSAAFDSADEVLEAALKSLGVKTKGMHPSAYRAVLEHMPRAGGSKRERAMADDARPSGAKSDLAKRFPHAASIRVM